MHYGDLNALHPFREGNGRSTRVFLEQLALQAGYRLDFSRTNGPEFISAARQNFDGDLKPIQEVFAKISTPTRAISFDQDERAVALAKHPELAIAFAALDKATDEAGMVIGDPAQRQRFLTESKALLVARWAPASSRRRSEIRMGRAKNQISIANSRSPQVDGSGHLNVTCRAHLIW